MVTATYQDYRNHRRMNQWRREWHRRFGVWPRKDDVAPIDDESVSVTHSNNQVFESRLQDQHGTKQYKLSTAAE